MRPNTIYATPKVITDIKECEFYHTMDIPGHGTVIGQWDLREDTSEYVGNVSLKNKRVLEVGSASGFLTAFMEKQGAEVIAYDLSAEDDWDIVPYVGFNFKQHLKNHMSSVGKIDNAFWFCHGANRLKARKVYGNAYAIPKEIGYVDISTFGAVLVHLRDPFLALQRALRITKETVIVTDMLRDKEFSDDVVFMPDYKTQQPTDVWWYLSPETVKRFIGVLGFEDTKVIYHKKKFEGCYVAEMSQKSGEIIYTYNKCGEKLPMFSVVGLRTKGCEDFL